MQDEIEIIDLENEFINKIAQSLYLDSKRDSFARETFRNLKYMTCGFYKDHTGYQRFLLGRKGIGKTVFLLEIQKVAKEIFSDNLITIYESYLDNTDSTLPSTLICKAIGIKVKNDIEYIERELIKTSKTVFIVLDEIQNLYIKNSNGKSIIGELSEIGCALEGRIHCIITGYSYNLRQLCFANLPINEKANYPNYTSLDLNSTKFSCRWLYPFLETNDFEKVVENIYARLNKKYNNQNQEILNAAMYLKTGGNPRLLTELIAQGICNSYSVSIKHFDGINSNESKYNKILEAVYKCTNAMADRVMVPTNEEIPYTISALSTWTKIIEYSIIYDELKDSFLEEIYNLVDSGHIRYIDDKKESYESCIGLGSPLIYLKLASRGKFDITLDEAAALKFSQDKPNEIAENVTLRCLAQNAKFFLKTADQNFKIKDTNVEKIVLRKEYKNILTDDNHANFDQVYLINRFFKESYQENQDSFGIEGLLLEKDNENDFIAHRIKIKLGVSCIKIEEAEKITTKVNTQLQNFKECFANANKTISKCVNYLVTTRGLDQSAKDHFENSEWEIVGRKELDQIWPDSIKALGKPYR